MKRLVANNVSPEMSEEVINHIKNLEQPSKFLLDQTPEFQLAKTIVNNLPTAPSNQLIYKVYYDIKDGKLDEIQGLSLQDQVTAVSNMLKSEGILFNFEPYKSSMEYRLYGENVKGE